MNVRKQIPAQFYNQQLLDSVREKGDFLADNVINQFATENSPQKIKDLIVWLTNSTKLDDKSNYTVVDNFIENLDFPAWLNYEKLKKGCDFFVLHQDSIAVLLGCMSLPYCYAAANGAMVLIKSERIKNDTQKRLEETATFVFDLMQFKSWQKKAVIPKIAKIRLLHACIRFYCKNSKDWQSEWGLAINQEDMAGTNLAFSYVIIKGLRKANIKHNEAQAQDFLYTWNVIGAMLGVEEPLLPQNLRQAFLLDKAIAKRQFRQSEAGQTLTKALVETLESFVPNQAAKSVPSAMMRFLLGNPMADLLGIAPSPIQSKLLSVLPMKFLFKNPQKIS